MEEERKMASEKSSILIFGGTGYIGKYMVKASISLGYSTFIYSRPLNAKAPPSKIQLCREFTSMGITLIHGELEHGQIVAAIKKVDIVISTVAYPQVLDQLKIIDAIKVAVILNYEEDIAMCTIKVANDPRTCNRIVVYRFSKNFISQNELISLWEGKTGRNFNRVFVPEEEIVKLSETLPPPQNITVSIIHSLFIKGDLVNFELGEDDIEVSKLYPDYKYKSIDELLDVFLVDPPAPTSAALE